MKIKHLPSCFMFSKDGDRQFLFLPFHFRFCSAPSTSLSVIRCNPPHLHRDRFDGVRDPVLSPGVPQDVCLRPLLLLCVLWRAVEVCQATLVKPPSCVIVLAAAAFNSAVAD